MQTVFGNAVCLSRVTGSPLGLADRLGEASRAVDQRQVAQVAAVMLNQVGGEANSTAALAPQRHEILAYAVYRMIRS